MRISRRNSLRCFGAVLAGAGLWSSVAWAEEPLLTLRNPAISNNHGEIRFTREDLAGLDWHKIETGNEFITGVGMFRGPLFADVISLIGHAGATKVRLIGQNGFYSEVDIAEMVRYGAVLAMELNNRALSLRDFGPIWVMYPLDDHPELQDSRFNSRLVWQLKAVELF